eukprot:gb/GFBE01027608.1/.p1 GENE.gb/GFBE01027608.1/~~gb/GFBE01027608.1/.p1  ORF type:complete len:647 (+),score=87.30 gb/GFBE01027608.1/:1-1941(+)
MRGMMRDMETLPSGRRRAGSCPPQGRPASSGSVLGTSRSTLRSGLFGGSLAGIRGAEFGLGPWSHLASGLSNTITARIISTDRGNLDLNSSRPARIPGTMQLTVLVPVLLGAPRRTAADVAGIGTTWTNGEEEEATVKPEIFDKLKIGKGSEDEKVNDESESVTEAAAAAGGGCDTCGICLQGFKQGEKLTALPCAADICPSVWHEDCVRKWLCQGHTPTCPLCRATIELGGTSAQNSASNSSFALEVRAALPLSAANAMSSSLRSTGLQWTYNSGNGSARGSGDGLGGRGRNASNQLLQQLGQAIIQDILLLALSQQSTGAGGSLAGLGGASSGSGLPQSLLNGGLVNGSTTEPMSSAALADLGGLLLRSLTTNGTLPVTLSAVEAWPGPSSGSGRGGASSSGNGAGGSSFNSGRRNGNGKGSGKGRGSGSQGNAGTDGGKGGQKGKGRRNNKRQGKGGEGKGNSSGSTDQAPAAADAEQHTASAGKGQNRRRGAPADQSARDHSSQAAGSGAAASSSSGSRQADSESRHQSYRTRGGCSWVPAGSSTDGVNASEGQSQRGGWASSSSSTGYGGYHYSSHRSHGGKGKGRSQQQWVARSQWTQSDSSEVTDRSGQSAEHSRRTWQNHSWSSGQWVRRSDRWQGSS